ncbi:putative F-box protein [Cocos nucifera]|uniref:Putative F-box protein n=1 Tax=Cocos nucifera TaxID=13894 RepID=A0A8K0IK87_COCNU|nr:putative F-box protein [Cocos nucifera]
MSWAELPPELQGLVLGRLELADYLRFDAVCRSWYWMVAQRPCLPKPQIPWLMLSDGTRDPDSHRFYSFRHQKMYKIHLPEIHGRLCIRSFEGWLITVDEISELHALNPLTGASLALPSITTTTFPSVAGAVRDSDGRIIDYVVRVFDVLRAVESMRMCYYCKAILHTSSAGSGHTAVVIYEYNDLAFTHAGDESWTVLEPPLPAMFVDIIFRKGLLHAMCFTARRW